MPQSSKDSQGGKTHAKKQTSSRGAASEAKVKKASGNSPTGPARHGEKKTTP